MLIVAFATVYFSDDVTLLNGLGIITVIVGSFRYGMVAVTERS